MHWVIYGFLQFGILFCFADAQCDNGWHSYDGRCYFISDTAVLSEVTWHAARSYCLEHGGELASVHSQSEMNFILDLSENLNYDGNLWIGLNQLQQGDESYKWSDGSSVSFTGWDTGQPNNNGLEKCTYTKSTKMEGGCYELQDSTSFVDGIIGHPMFPPAGCTSKFILIDDITFCTKLCDDFENCYSFTFFSNSHPSNIWKGECLACAYEVVGNNSVENEYATSGIKIACENQKIKLWYSDNCGMKYGFVCKKDPGSSGPATVPPTAKVPGYCPKDYFGIGNKCYKLFDLPYQNSVSWNEAREKCLQEPGIEPDLASITSEFEQAIITASMTSTTQGYWIGIRKKSGIFVWYDNSDTSFTNWDTAQQYYDCGEIINNPKPIGSWRSIGCTNKRGYICQTYKDENYVISTPSYGNPNDCDDGFQSYWYGCYKFETTPATWSNAKDHCKAFNSELASIHDEPENAYLLAITYSQTPIWIGLHQVDDEYIWLDDWPILFTNWGTDEPGNGEGCVAMESDGRWNDTECNNQYPFVCKQTEKNKPTLPPEKEGFCPNAYWEELGGHCYYFSSQLISWEGAERNCIDLAGFQHEGTLASIHDRVTNEWLYKKASEIAIDGMWIGLKRKSKDDPWEWSDNTAANFFHWAPGEPSDDDGSEPCVEMNTKSWPGMWNHRVCYFLRPFVCKADKAPPTTTPIIPSQVPGECPSADWYHYGDSCYLFYPDESVAWYEAHFQCQKYGATALASLRDTTENWFIWNKLKQLSQLPITPNAWIGLMQTYEDDKDEYHWIDETPFNFTNWASEKPDSSVYKCVEISGETGQWNDISCESKRGYVCKYHKDDSTEPPEEDKGSPSVGTVIGIIFAVVISVTVLQVSVHLCYVYHTRRSKPQLPSLYYTNKNYHDTDTLEKNNKDWDFHIQNDQ